MKRSFIKSVLVVATAAVVLTGCAVTSHTEKAAGVDFSSYKSFAWANNNDAKKADRADNDIIDNNIKNSISQELEKKGWKETETGADVLLDYNIAVKKGHTREIEPYYPYTPYWYGGHGRIYSIWSPSALMGYHSYNVPFKEGQLTVNMVDAKTNKLIWQGWAQGEINSRNITTKQATEEVKSIFKKFDYPG